MTLSTFLPMRPALALAALFCLLAIAPARGALHWEAMVREIDAAPFEETINTAFKFTNAGEVAVTISETHASCGCTVPTLTQRTFAPGESGELHVVFQVGEAVGRQEKTITVTAQEPGTTSYLLTLRVTIPDLFAMEPRFQSWRVGEPPAAKTITIRALRPELARPVNAESRDTRFAVALHESTEEPGVFTVTITPAQTEIAMFTSITIATSAPAEKKRVLTLFATVR